MPLLLQRGSSYNDLEFIAKIKDLKFILKLAIYLNFCEFIFLYVISDYNNHNSKLCNIIHS